MKELHAGLKKPVQDSAEFGLAKAMLVPQGMIEDDQCFRKFMKRRQKFQQARSRGIAGIRGQVVHNQMRLALRQIVNTQMKNRSFKGYAPLHGKRNLNRVRQFPQRGGRSDAVMIGKRYQAHQSQIDFNLIAFQFKGHFGRQWRRPVSLGKIDGPDRFLALLLQSPAQQRPFFSVCRDKEQALLGMVRMTVKGNSRPVLTGDVRLLPKT